MRGPRSLAILALGVALLGCDPAAEPSDAGQYQLAVGLFAPLGSASHLVLVGSTVPFEILRITADDDGALSTFCVTKSGSGSIARVDDETFFVDATGVGAVELAAPMGCSDDPLAEVVRV